MKDDLIEVKNVRSSGSERIIDILLHLLGEIQGKKDMSEIDLTNLSALGFTDAEISTAFSWLHDKLSIETAMPMPFEAPNVASLFHPTGSHGFRVYHEFERKVLTPAAQGYLIQLRELGLLSETELENLLDRVSQLGFMRLDVRDVKELVSGVVFDFDDSQRVGSRMMLNVNDTIH